MYVTLKEGDLLQLRNFTMLLLSFAGFLRFDEVSQLRLGDIRLLGTHMEIFIESSKTDVYRDGHIRSFAPDCCPVKIIYSYILQNSLREKDEYLFRPMTWFKKRGVHRMRKGNKPISYTACREQALSLVKKVGLEPKNFGLHSARSGGATAAANRGVPDRLFKRHGRWLSEKAKDGYVKDSLANLLSVSRNLGL